MTFNKRSFSVCSTVVLIVSSILTLAGASHAQEADRAYICRITQQADLTNLNLGFRDTRLDQAFPDGLSIHALIGLIELS